MNNNQIILEVKSGSHLYGTQTATSDIDQLGIYIPSFEEEIGLFLEEEKDLSIVDKNSENKNTQNAIDRKFYHIRKFIKLASQNNPNVLELLYPSEESIISISPVGKYLLEHSSIFLHKGLIKRFLNYAKSQKHKMIIKTEKFSELNELLAVLKEIAKDTPKMYLSELKYNELFLKVAKDNIQKDSIKVGDLSFPLNIFVKEAIKRISNRIEYGTNRQDLILKYGFDSKFASHLIRLLYEAIELLEKNSLTFPLKEADLILSIKNGEKQLNEVIELSEILETRILMLEKTTSLPENPDMSKINELLINIFKMQYNMED